MDTSVLYGYYYFHVYVYFVNVAALESPANMKTSPKGGLTESSQDTRGSSSRFSFKRMRLLWLQFTIYLTHFFSKLWLFSYFGE